MDSLHNIEASAAVFDIYGGNEGGWGAVNAEIFRVFGPLRLLKRFSPFEKTFRSTFLLAALFEATAEYGPLLR